MYQSFDTFPFDIRVLFIDMELVYVISLWSCFLFMWVAPILLSDRHLQGQGFFIPQHLSGFPC